MTTRRASKVDANQLEIKRALQAAGYQTYDTHALGAGFPDLVVVSRSGRVAVLLEVKAETDARVTPAEAQFMVGLVGPAYRIVTNAQDTLNILSELEKV